MDRFIKKTKDFIFAEQGGIFSSAMILSVMIVISRIFGFLRYRILAGSFSKGDLDIFFASFRIPDLVFEILITGALTSSFIPIFIRYQKNKEELEKNISTIFNIIFMILFVFVIVLYLCMDTLLPWVTPGFKGEKLKMVIEYSKLLLIGQLPFLVAGNFLTGIAQAKKNFLVTAIAPVIYNVSIILATLFFAPTLRLLAPVVGVIIGSICFFFIQVPILHIFSFNYRFVLEVTHGVKEFFSMIGPRILTVIISQFDATIDLTLTTLLGPGSYTIFYFAQHLQLLPVSVIGVAFGQASLPYLSELFEQGKIEEMKKIIVDSLLNLLFLTIPIMVFFIFARTPLVRLFFGGEKFDWDATVQTAFTLSYFSLSLPFHSVYYLLTRCFYAITDTRTPFFASLLAIVINTGLSLLFILVFHLPVYALAISFSISVIVNSTILFILLIKKLKGFNLRFFVWENIKICACALCSAPLAYGFIKLFDDLILDTSRTINVFFILFFSGVIYILLYLLLSWFLNVKEIYLITDLFMKAKQYQKKITEVHSSYE